MLFRDPFFLLYMLHVGALFLIAFWPRLSGAHRQKQQESASCVNQQNAGQPVQVTTNPCLTRVWSLGTHKASGEMRFRELEDCWTKECTTKFAQLMEQIRLV
jgi:hypothetical protein